MSIKPSNFELIPNEILLEIFEYLFPYDIFQSFYFLNKRYNTFLLSLYYRIDLMNISKKNFDYHNYFLFTLIPHRINSFRCEDIFDRLIYQIHLSNFIALKYLTIENLNIDNLRLIISQLNYLQKLVYLNLQTRTNLSNENQIIFNGRLPSFIETCILNINKQISFHENHSYPKLRDLTINQCTINDILVFLHIYTPQLQQLTVTLIDENIRNKIDASHHLQSLVIHTVTIPFSRLTNSLLTSFPYLQRMSINATGIDYTNGKQWSTLLSSKFPGLITFQLHIIFPHNDAPTSNDRLQLLNTFQTSYFRFHQWYFAIMHCPSITHLRLFSIPMIDKKISFNLYQTEIETTKIDKTIFNNINQLSLFLTNSNENINRICFPNVQHLRFISQFQEHEIYSRNLYVDISHCVEFSKLKSIEFCGSYFPSTSLVLLDYTPKLHSLIIPLNSFIKMTKNLTDETICHRLMTLIKHLTITSIDNVKNFEIFERLPIVFPRLDSLSLSLQDPHDLYILMILILPKMSRILKVLTISIETPCKYEILDRFMLWLMDYMHTRDLDLVDIKLTDYKNFVFFKNIRMDPFVLSRNAFHSYCSEYQSRNLEHETAIRTINQRYENFLQTLDRLRMSFEETTRNRNINSISNSAKDTLTLPSPTKNRSNKKNIQKSNKQRMPKIMITVSCAEHRTKQQPNIKIN